MNQEEVIVCHCLNPDCLYGWMQRTPWKPGKCPHCQSRHWSKPEYWNKKKEG